MLRRWKTPLITFFLFSLFLYSGITFFTQHDEEPFERFRIPGKDRYFVFIITAQNSQQHSIQTLVSILEQSYRNFRIVYIDDGSSDDTYVYTKNFIDSYYPNAPISLIKNSSAKGVCQNAYEQIQLCNNYEIIALLSDNCSLNHKDVLKDFNDIYKVQKVWLAYGKHCNTKEDVTRQCRPVPDLSIFTSMRKRYWNRPLFKTFYAGLFRKVKLEDFFFQGKFINEKYDAAYMFPMIEMAGKHVGFINDVVCKTIIEKEEDKDRILSSPKDPKEWICKAQPYAPLLKHPGAVMKEYRRIRKADLLVFSCDRPLQLYAHLESINRYLTNLNSISVIYRAGNSEFHQAYETIRTLFPHIRFIKQSNSYPEIDFKPLALQAIFENSIEASPYVIFSSDNLIIKDHIDINQCIKMLKDTGAYYFSLDLSKKWSSLNLEKESTNTFPQPQVGNNIFGWQIEGEKGDWKYANLIQMNLYRKIDLHKPFYSIDFKHPLELEQNWAEKTKPFLRVNRQRVGLSYNDPKVINLGSNLRASYSNKMLLHIFNQGLKIDIDALLQEGNTHSNKNKEVSFIKR